MASAEEIAEFRRLINDTVEPYEFTDEELNTLLDNAESTDAAALYIWEQKAASLSTIVNVSESGSSRSTGDLFKNAQAMITMYRQKLGLDGVQAQGASRTRSIRRV